MNQENQKLFRPSAFELIPSLATWANLICGACAIVSVTLHQNAALAAAFIFAGWLFDLIDGWVARKILSGTPERLSTMAQFGTALDVSSDTVTFGLAPAICFYSLWVRHLPLFEQILMVPVCIVYVCATAYRLARFMCIRRPGSLWFVGLFSDAAGLTASAFMSAAVLIESTFTPWALAGILLVLAFLMTSTIKFPHNKTWINPFPHVFVVLLALGIGGWAMTGAVALGYAIFWMGFIMTPVYHSLCGHYARP